MPHTRTSGVYQIRCLPTGKLYVGSAVDVRARWGQHRRELRRGEHGNQYLQHAWDKYGEENFEFAVLELANKEDLLRVEQEWIDRTRCAESEVGFNIFDIAGSPGQKLAQVWEGFIDPDGNEVTIFNLQAFCREHGLNATAMRTLAIGGKKLKSHKGWTHPNSVRQRDYIKTYAGFIDPEGNLVDPITNLAAFCREHGLDNTHMVAILQGRICSHRGWTHISARQRADQKVYTGFINPEGERVTITNLSEFCRQHGLHPVRMHQLKNGQRKKHKGWIWRPEND